MARNRSLTDFDKFSKTNKDNKSKETKNEQVKPPNETKQEDVTVVQNTETKDVHMKGTHKTETKEETPKLEDFAVGSIARRTQQIYQERLDKKRVEDTHIRRTFLVDKDLDKRLDKLAKKRERGFKTLLINQAIEQAIREYEEL